MNYKETLEFLYSSLPMYHRLGPSAYKASLDNTIAFDNYLGNPHRNYRSIHIAGTNGKGSVSHMLAAVLQEAGYKTGLYTSPHLKDFRERIRVNGKMIEEDYVAGFISGNFNLIKKIEPSFFEMSVALAFQYFSDEKIDIAVVETGMGGRLDSTNIIHPVLSIITNIGLDHVQFLGDTIEKIAAEKAGIIKKNTPVVIGEWQDETAGVFTEFANKAGSDLFQASKKYLVTNCFRTPEKMQVMNISSGDELIFEDLRLDLLGLYQKKNVVTVLQSIDILINSDIIISRKIIYDALSKVKTTTGLRGRWDEISYNPLIICDTGHNASGLKEVLEQIRHTPFKKLHVVMGIVSDKDPDSILSLFPADADYYFTRADIPRALDENILKEYAEKHNLSGEAFHTVHEAVETAKSRAVKEDLIFIGGSTFIVAEALP